MDLDKIQANSKEIEELDNMPDLPNDSVIDDIDENNVENNEIETEETEETDETEEETTLDDIEEAGSDEEEMDEEPVDDEQEDNQTANEPELVLNINGKEITINNKDELLALTQNAVQKSTLLEQYKDDIAKLEAFKQEGLTDEELFLLIEARKGNKKAKAKLLKKIGIEPDELYEIDENEIENYKPQEYKVNPDYIEVKGIIEDLRKDETKFTMFNNFITSELPENERTQVIKDPQAVKFIADLMKSGLYEEIAPIYMKKKLLGKVGMAGIIEAYEEYQNRVNTLKQKTKQTLETQNKKKSEKRKKASAGIKKNKPSSKTTKKDFLDMDDKEFEEYYQKVLGFNI